MDDLLERLSSCVEVGKVDRASSHPPSLKGHDGASELCKLALERGVRPEEIMNRALIPAMSRIGDKFSQGTAFIPDMLISAKAMSAAMKHLKPYFISGQIKRKGVFVIGTVKSDLHDIGKNLVAMAMEGAGWEVIDLGVDAGSDKFLAAIGEHPGCIVGMSALLTTTMANMGSIIRDIRNSYPDTVILVGGAPLSDAFSRQIGANFYSPDPQGAIRFLAGQPLRA